MSTLKPRVDPGIADIRRTESVSWPEGRRGPNATVIPVRDRFLRTRYLGRARSEGGLCDDPRRSAAERLLQDVCVLRVTRRKSPVSDEPTYALGHTYLFDSDYVLRGSTTKCGPGYWDQTESRTCEWFAHDFTDGLTAGRYDIWVEWRAPCSVWQDLGLTDTCADPGEVTSRFASSVNMPFYNDYYAEGLPPPYDPATLFAEDPRPIAKGVPGS